MPMKRSNWTVHLRVAGRDCGYWAAASGGGKTSDDSTYYDWDGEVKLGGQSTREPVELRKLYRRDVHANYDWFDRQVDNDAACVITRTPTGDDGISWGSPIVMQGVLAGCSPPEIEKGSSDGGELTLTVNANAKLA
jgi:hypothetical protein